MSLAEHDRIASQPARGPETTRESAAEAARRLYLYAMAFAGLVAALIAGSGLLALLVAMATLRAGALLGGDAVRQQAAFYLAALLVGVPIWLGHWAIAQRLAARRPSERRSPQRRLFLAAVFAVTSIVALFGLAGLLRFVLTLPGAEDAQPSALAGIQSGARLLLFGAAWWAYLQVDARDEAGVADRTHPDDARDLAIYALAGTALVVLALGAYAAVRELTIGLLRLLPAAPAPLLGAPSVSPWTVWGSIAAQMLAGGAVWLAVWHYDLGRAGRHRLRIVYLYLALIVAAPVALGSATYGLYELLRRLFGYQPAFGGAWNFLRDAVPLLVVGCVVALHHAGVLCRQRSPDADTDAGIPWPRRPALFLLALLGLAAAAPAFVAIVWVGTDALVNGAALSAPGWWRDRLSLAVAAGLVGGVAWLGAWLRLERAAAAAARERAALERRIYLGGIVLVAALAGLGFLIAMLWLLLRAALGEPLDAAGIGTALKEASSVVVAAGIAAYHARLFQRDVREAGAPRRRLRLLTLVAPGAEAAIAALRRRDTLRVEVVGEADPDGLVPQLDLPALQRALEELEAHGSTDRALLILYPDGGSLYPYRRIAA